MLALIICVVVIIVIVAVDPDSYFLSGKESLDVIYDLTSSFICLNFRANIFVKSDDAIRFLFAANMSVICL